MPVLLVWLRCGMMPVFKGLINKACNQRSKLPSDIRRVKKEFMAVILSWPPFLPPKELRKNRSFGIISNGWRRKKIIHSVFHNGRLQQQNHSRYKLLSGYKVRLLFLFLLQCCFVAVIYLFLIIINSIIYLIYSSIVIRVFLFSVYVIVYKNYL